MQIDIRRLRSRLMVAIFLVSIGTLTVQAQAPPLSISAPTSALGTGSIGLPGSPIAILTILDFSDFRVIPILAPDVASTDEMLTLSDALLCDRGSLKNGDSVVFVAGQPIGRPGTTNLMKLHRTGELR